MAAQRCNLGERFFAGRIRVLGDFHVAWKLKQRERDLFPSANLSMSNACNLSFPTCIPFKIHFVKQKEKIT